MKKIFIFSLFFVLAITACQKQETEAEIPVTIQQLIDSNNSCICLPWINLYSWRESKVYVLAARGPACNGIPFYYDRAGNKLTMQPGYTLDQFLAESVYIKTVWDCQKVANSSNLNTQDKNRINTELILF